jgi:dipeptidyl aminopeptidase/acylaminoacyl peptidase
MARSAPYGEWSSPITADAVIRGVKGFAALASNGDALFWLEARPEEGGRLALVRQQDGRTDDLTPLPYNVRTRVHEYGGGAFLITDRHAYFVDFATQDLHEVNLADGAIRRITTTGADARYADFQLDRKRRRLIAVGERHTPGGVRNFLVAVDLANGAERVLHEAHDFYSSPRLSPDGTRLCFVTWDHPNMPWDGTQLHVGMLADDHIEDVTVIAGGVAESIVEPRWLDTDRLVFVSDASGWWNLYAHDASGTWCIAEEAAEYVEPPWNFGGSHYVAATKDHLICAPIVQREQSLAFLSVQQGFRSPLPSPWIAFHSLTMHRGRLCFIGRATDRLGAIVAKDPASGDEQILASAGTLSFDASWIARAEAIAFPTRDGATGHAYYYPPTNPQCREPEGARPPLLVMSHGGPTGSVDRGLNLRALYYTSRGWGVVDVNYGGSTGFGRAYRERLVGRWGIVDVDDCVAAVDHLIATGRADPDRVAIRGGSAGGYTTLAALTFTTRFRAGASHYGIGDLELLARDTHKFESRYADSLVGPYPGARDTYIARSPLHHVDRLSCPVIFFQGLEDKIVLPNQSETMVEALRRKGIPVAYLAFEGEQHGFRDARNIKRAIEAEYLFFARVFGFTPADPLPPIDIENL